MSSMLTLAMSIIGGLLVALGTIVSWIGARVVDQLKEVKEQLAVRDVQTLSSLNALDTRIVRLEVLTRKRSS